MLERLFSASGDFVPGGLLVMSGSNLVSSPGVATEVPLASGAAMCRMDPQPGLIYSQMSLAPKERRPVLQTSLANQNGRQLLCEADEA